MEQTVCVWDCIDFARGLSQGKAAADRGRRKPPGPGGAMRGGYTDPWEHPASEVESEYWGYRSD